MQDMIRISDIGLGSNAMRITSIRSLPDAEHDAPTMDSLGEEEREQLDGDHINVEVSFAYKALPSGNTASSKAHNAQ
jgi:Ca2+-dependent lipid-binding protein